MTGHHGGSKLRPEKKPKGEQKTRKENDATIHQGGWQLHGQLRTDTQALLELLFPPTKLLTMKVITWNIIGLNGRSKQRILRNCIKMEDSDILLLQETKCTGKTVEEILKRCWRTCNSYHIDSKGVAGGHPLESRYGHSRPRLFHSRNSHNPLSIHRH